MSYEIDADKTFESIWRELSRSTIDRRHEFRRLVLATSSNGDIRQRIVILRKVIKDVGFVFYTDTRSQKVKDIDIDNHVSVLAYSHKLKMQLSCSGWVEKYEDASMNPSAWDLRSLKDYTTILAPGAYIELNEDVQYDHDRVHFTSYKINLNVIEYLQLSHESHVRLQFKKKDDVWYTQRLVP